MAFLDNSLTFQVEYFQKKNVDLLAQIDLNLSSGQVFEINSSREKPYVNSASVKNTGWEFTVGYRKQLTKDFNIDATFNISTLSNKVLALGDNVQPITSGAMSSYFNDSPSITMPGYAIGSFYGYKIDGFDADGNFIFSDTDNNGIVNADDKVILGNPIPDFSYGLNLSMTYKDFDLTMFFQGVQGNEIFNQMKYTYYFTYSNNCVTDVLNAWSATNHNTNIPIMKTQNTNGGNSLPSEFYIEDGSYLRCKNLQLGYTVPNKVIGKLGLSHLRFYAGVQNLFTITKVTPVRKMPRNADDYVRKPETAEAVWDFIQEDLEKAKELLPVKGYWNSDNQGRVTKAAAAALQGLCYMYRTGIESHYGTSTKTYYNEAAQEFANIINGKYGTYQLASDYSWNFDVAHENDANPESILEIQFLGDVNNTGFNPGTATSGLAFDARGLMLPGAGVGYEGVAHNWLYNEFVNSIDRNGCTDIRMFSTLMFDDLKPEIKLHTDAEGNAIRLEGPGGFHWEDFYPATASAEGFQTVANTLAHPFKAGIKKGLDYSMPTLTNADGTPKTNGVGSGTKEYVYNQPRAHGVNWRYLRYADVLLLYAEAVLNGGTQGAMSATEAVNLVRNRAELESLTSASLEDVKHERVLELAFEGHRFYDLLRWGELAQRFQTLTTQDPYFKKFVSSSDYKGFVTNKHEWLPIPINEMNSNPNIESNNPGY